MANLPLILVSNDDGYAAMGIHSIVESLQEAADVVVCAPESEQSSTSHSITLNRPLRLAEKRPGWFSVDGTPADCVYTALNAGTRVLPRRPDLVVSGINHGLNLGNDVFYSGTVAAAREAALRGIDALALSATEGTDHKAAGQLALRLARELIDRRWAGSLKNEEDARFGVLWNVNFPPGSAWPTRPGSLGHRQYEDGVEFRMDPRGGEYLWIGGGGVAHGGDEGTDTHLYDSGCVGVTPLSLRLWNRAQASQVSTVLGSL